MSAFEISGDCRSSQIVQNLFMLVYTVFRAGGGKRCKLERTHGASIMQDV